MASDLLSAAHGQGTEGCPAICVSTSVWSGARCQGWRLSCNPAERTGFHTCDPAENRLSSIPAFVMRRVFRKKPDGRSWSRRRVPAGAGASLRHAAEQAGGAGMPSCREFQIAARSVKAVRRRRATMQRGFGRAAVLPVRRLAAGFPWQRRVRRCRCQGNAGPWGCRQAADQGTRLQAMQDRPALMTLTGRPGHGFRRVYFQVSGA